MKNKIMYGVALVVSMGLLLCGCGNKQKNLTEPLEDIMTKVYENIDSDKLPMMLGNIEITKDNLEGYTGLKELEFESGIASESSVGSIAHSVVLLRVKDDADIEKIKKDIKANVNPRKWICVGVDDEENVIVDNIGNTIILIMDNEIAEDLHENFLSLNK